MIGFWEFILIILILLLLFGARKLPEIGESLGKGLKNFKNALKGKDEIDVTPLRKDKEENKES